MSKKRIVVVAPGRGSYNKDTLGYLNLLRPKAESFIDYLDGRKQRLNEITPSELDDMPEFQSKLHTKGEHASILIYTCSGADFVSIDRNEYEIVAVTGNSMGWYIAMALGGALNRDAAFDVINTMGSMMKEKLVGGQILYPWCNDDWTFNRGKRQEILQYIDEVNSREGMEAYLSIDLGGYAVIAGNRAALSEMMKGLPQVEHFPFQLINHAAFHTPMMMETSQRAFDLLGEHLFESPEIPMIDGRGHIWQPYSTDIEELREYTLGHQVYEPYNFTTAIQVALKEFAPDQIWLLGPGNSLGGVVGQVLVNESWRGMSSKEEFQRIQAEEPFMVSMGLRQ